jgi:hypothetical protein
MNDIHTWASNPNSLPSGAIGARLMVVAVSLAALTTTLGCGASDHGTTTSAPLPEKTNDSPMIVPLFVRDASGAAINPATVAAQTPLYESRAGKALLAPDRHQITWSEFSKPKGSAAAQCTDEGVSVSVNLTGLIANGVYTLEDLTFREPGFDPTLANLIGLGAAGTPDGGQNMFKASPTGEGGLTVTTAGGPLSVKGAIAACPLRDEFEWHVVALYHVDGESHGPVPGPDGTFAEQLGFIFRQTASPGM